MTIDRETIETLRDEPELLAIADAVQSAGAQLGPVAAPRRPRRRPVRIAAVVLAAAAAIGIVLSSPWDNGGPSFVDRALAAVGNRPVLHVVVRYTYGERIDLRTGASSPAHRDLELWYDANRHLFRAETRLDGRVVYRSSGKGNLSYEPFLISTLSLFRKALKDGKLHDVGKAVIRGRHAIVVEARLPHDGLARYYLDEHSLQVLRMQYFLHGVLGSQMDVLEFDSVSREEARLPKHPAPFAASSSGSSVSSYGSGSSAGRAALAEARTAFGRPALWPGRSVQGHRLINTELESEKSTTRGRTVRGRHLLLDYGPQPSAGDAYLEIDELLSNSPLLGIEGIDPAPRPGYLDVTTGETTSSGSQTRTQWTGTMAKDGFTIQLTSWSRSTLIAAARAMRPVP